MNDGPVPAQRRSRAVIPVMAVASLAIAFFATWFGTVSIEGMAAWSEWLSSGEDSWSQDARILSLRIPRVLLAWVSGGALAVAGAVMQTLLRNGLATPYTLGIASASSFGAFLTVAMPALAIFGTFSAVIYSLASALLCLLLVLRISRHSRRADGLLLAGITLNFLFGAGIMLVRYLADPFELATMERWLMGSLSAVQIQTALAPLPWVALGLALLFLHIRALDQLAFDEEMAAARGVAVERTKSLSLLGAGLLTAGVVAYSGPIGFLGLLVPHAVRWFTGLQHARLFPACFLAGGGFLVLADLLARSVEWGGRNSDLPVGIVTALIGGPFFLALLIRGR